MTRLVKEALFINIQAGSVAACLLVIFDGAEKILTGA